MFPVSKSFDVPLAERMRPRSLDEFVGQPHILGKDTPLRLFLSADGVVPSMILGGPPGVGKTTLARLIANHANCEFIQLSGVLDGLAEFRKAVARAKEVRELSGRKTLLLIDEIHRFNRAQQDAFLPHVESGLICLIGQTTENISFRIRGALLSRLKVFVLKPLEEQALRLIVLQALEDEERGLGSYGVGIADEALSLLVRLAAGDARSALNGLEWALMRAVARGNAKAGNEQTGYERGEDAPWGDGHGGDAQSVSRAQIERDDVLEALGEQGDYYDSSGDAHYDCVSAFIKSMRGSDPDAALYYMVRALESGEDPLFISRRMVIFASEDVSCDPRALQLAIAVDNAVERIGMPEARINMAHGAVYLSCASKSNASYLALRAMEKVVRDYPNLEIPKRLRNAPTELMREFGHGVGYRYPHDAPGGFVPERYLPEVLKNLRVYTPTDRGLDKAIKERLTQYEALIRQSGVG